MKTFKSVKDRVQAEIIIKKSRFIAHVFPADSEEEAKNYLTEIKEEYKDATHNVFAWQVGVEKILQRCGDDGEPSGTAGRPILEVIKQRELTNVLIVVTRYFGGIKLGAGGLIRAYSQAARAGLDKAEITEKTLHDIYRVSVDYPLWSQLSREMEKWGKIKEVNYTQNVEAKVFVLSSLSGDFEKSIADLTAGNAVLKKTGSAFAPIK
ncbi:MAG: YigZ family protein [Clostridia bacterium]|nr:YigZ family protein [Clostridia bacterium]